MFFFGLFVGSAINGFPSTAYTNQLYLRSATFVHISLGYSLIHYLSSLASAKINKKSKKINKRSEKNDEKRSVHIKGAEVKFTYETLPILFKNLAVLTIRYLIVLVYSNDFN